MPTTRYRGTLPITEKKVLGVEVQAAPPRVEVWIDAKDRVRRIKIIGSGSVRGAKGSSATAMTMDFLEFGPVPRIELPQEDEIYDATDQIESELKSSAGGT